jgi:hypothetical protein
MDGQVARLRAADGVHFTRAGALKLAHFVEGDLRRDLEGATPGAPVPATPRDVATPPAEASAPPPAPVAQQKPVAGPVLSLTGPPVATGGLLAQRSASKGGSASPVDQVLAHGQAPDSRARELSP